MKRVYQAIEDAVHEHARERQEADDAGVVAALNEARELGKELFHKLEDIERRLTMRVRMARAAV